MHQKYIAFRTYFVLLDNVLLKKSENEKYRYSF